MLTMHQFKLIKNSLYLDVLLLILNDAVFIVSKLWFIFFMRTKLESLLKLGNYLEIYLKQPVSYSFLLYFKKTSLKFTKSKK